MKLPWHRLFFAVFGPILVIATEAEAELTPSADGLTVYDSNLGVNWLANANLAATDPFGVNYINPDGSMSWQTALNWVAALNTAHFLGHTNWTLPATPIPPVIPPATSSDASCGLTSGSGFGFGYGCSSSGMGELFYKQFGGTKGASISSIVNSNTSLFNNFQPYLYWSGTAQNPGGASFSFGNGFQGTNVDVDSMYAIPEFPMDHRYHRSRPPIRVSAQRRPQLTPRSCPAPVVSLSTTPRMNITWLADANLAATNHFGITEGINPDGSMNYKTATAWIDAMNAANYLGQHNWRLPTSANSTAGYDRTGSELGELFYTELGSQGGSTILLTHDSALNLFSNFQPYLYWSSTVTSDNLGGNGHSTLSFGSGFQGGNFDANDLYVVPVLDGQPVPGPVGDYNYNGVVDAADYAVARLAGH